MRVATSIHSRARLATLTSMFATCSSRERFLSCDSPARDRRWCSSRARARLATFTPAIFAVAAPALVSALRRSRSRSTLLQLPQLRSPFGQSHSRSSLLGNPLVPAFRRSRPCLPLGGHVPCPSFDDHVMLAFTVPVLACVFRRLRSHPRSGHVVVRSCERPSTLASVFTSDRPLSKRIGRAHLLVRRSCSAFRHHDPHSVGSQSTGSRVRVTFRRR